MNFKKKILYSLAFILLICPFNVLAYSDYIIASGQNIGIEVNTDGILVVGFYNVSGKNIGKNSGFQLGDKIIKVNDINVLNINDMIEKIDKYIENDSVKITVLRNNKEISLNLSVKKDEGGVYKTGLYVKDQITGVGTLTFIDPETKKYGALGHEIIESNSRVKVEVKDGKIFSSKVNDIVRSTDKTTGEKNASFYTDKVFGNIEKNTIYGIFGNYLNDFNTDSLYKVGNVDDIKLGEAEILTVLKDNDIKKYKINILKIYRENDTKNILFEINDSELKNKTNGIIKGMSGSPIIQDGKIIGAVTHAIVNDNNKGYGIFITKMLEESDK